MSSRPLHYGFPLCETAQKLPVSKETAAHVFCLHVEAIRSPKTSVNFYRNTKHHNSRAKIICNQFWLTSVFHATSCFPANEIQCEVLDRRLVVLGFAQTFPCSSQAVSDPVCHQPRQLSGGYGPYHPYRTRSTPGSCTHISILHCPPSLILVSRLRVKLEIHSNCGRG
jgi:hypothetical protein